MHAAVMLDPEEVNAVTRIKAEISQRRRRRIIRLNQELVHQMQAEAASLILGASFGGHGSRMAESVRASSYVHRPCK